MTTLFDDPDTPFDAAAVPFDGNGNGNGSDPGAGVLFDAPEVFDAAEVFFDD